MFSGMLFVSLWGGGNLKNVENKKLEWYHSGTIGYHMVPQGTTWYHMVPYGTIRYHMVPYGTIWYPMVPYGTMWYHVPYGTI